MSTEFGRLTVTAKTARPGKVRCKCKCGRVREAWMGALRAGLTYACKRCTKKYRRKDAKKRHAAELTEADVRAYEAGEVDARALGGKYGRCPATIRGWLRERGVRVRATCESPGWKAQVEAARERREMVKRLKADGVAAVEIGRVIGVSKARVYQILGTA